MADDLPSQWTHEPDRVLKFEPGSKVSDIDTDSVRDSGRQGRRAQDPGGRNAVFADHRRSSTPTPRRRQALHPAGAAGHGHRGQGGIVKSHVVAAGSPMGIGLPRLQGAHRGGTSKHHYLWRIRKALPAAGHIGCSTAPHYEDVLVVRVHNLVPPEVWGARYDEINAFERNRRRRDDDREGRDVRVTRRAEAAAARLEDPTKYWKYKPGRPEGTRRVAGLQGGPIRRCWTRPRRTTHRGTSCRATRSGTAGWRSPNCSSRRSPRWICLARSRFRSENERKKVAAL